MKKLLLSVFLVSGLSIGAMAADESFRVPSSNNGHPDVAARYGAVDKVYLATSAAATLMTNADGVTVTAGLIYWIVRPTTGAAGTYLELRDTNTANTSTSKMLPWIPAVSTGQVVLPFHSPVLTFDPPIPFYNGLSVNVYPTAADPAIGTEWAIGYRPRR